MFFFVLKLFLRAILFHGKLSFDNLIYFKLYGNLYSAGGVATSYWLPLTYVLIYRKLPCLFSTTSSHLALQLSW